MLCLTGNNGCSCGDAEQRRTTTDLLLNCNRSSSVLVQDRSMFTSLMHMNDSGDPIQGFNTDACPCLINTGLVE